MKTFRQLIWGILTAGGAALLVFSAAALSLAEANTGVFTQQTPDPLITPTLSETANAAYPAAEDASGTPAAHCASPQGWIQYSVNSDDTLASLAQQSNLTVDEILKANCLLSDTLLPNTVLYLPFTQMTPTVQVPPALPTAPLGTDSSIPDDCVPPPGWVQYTVQSGENLYRLSLQTGVKTEDLQAANCLNNTTIITGQKLYLPVNAAPTPSPTAKGSAAPQTGLATGEIIRQLVS